MMVLSGWFEFFPKAMWTEIEWWLDSHYDILFLFFVSVTRAFQFIKIQKNLKETRL